MKKRTRAYFASLIVIVLASFGFLYFAPHSGLTGFAVFSDDTQGEFDSGNYSNTAWNGSAVVLSGGNLSGSFTSQVFDGGGEVNWNNLSWTGGLSNTSALFGVDASGSVYKSDDGGSTWSEQTSDYGRGGSTNDLMIDSEKQYIVFGGSAREVWTSSDLGVSWSVVNDSFANSNLQVGAVSFDGLIYVADTSGDVYRSSDQGVSWDLRGDANGGASNNPLGIDVDSGGNVFLVDGSGAVYKSDDGGSTWSEQTSDYGGGAATDGLEIDNSDDLYILFNTRIHKSSDEGMNWTIINDSISPYGNSLVELHVDEGDAFFILDATGRVFTSNDLGISWSETGDMNGGNNNDPKGIGSLLLNSNASFEVRACSLSDCSDGSFAIADLDSLGLSGRYFQYRFNLTRSDSTLYSFVDSVAVDYTSNEGISPNISFGASTFANGTYIEDSVFVDVDLNDESALYSFVDFNESLIAFYKMNESSGNILDYSSHGNDGVNSGASYGASGKFGTGLSFNGSDSISVSAVDYPENFTFSAWITSSSSTTQGILEIDGGSVSHRSALWVAASGNPGIMYGDGKAYRTAFTDVSDGVWHHVVARYNGTPAIFVDGSLIALSSESIGGDASSSDSFVIGALNLATPFPFDGTMDEVLVFDRALSAVEIGALYNASSYSQNFSDLAYGEYSFYAYAQDVHGNENQTELRAVTLNDNSAPSVSVAFPGAVVYFNGSLDLNYSIVDNEGDLNSCWYSMNEGGNVSLSGCLNSSFVVSEGTYSLFVYANDSSGLEGSDSVLFSVDETGVNVSISSPSGTLSTRTNISLAYSAGGDNLTCWYNVETSVGGSIIANTSLAGCNSTEFSVANDGDFVANVFVNNSFGTLESDSSSFSVDTSSSSSGSGSGSSGGSGGGGGGGFVFATGSAGISFLAIENKLLKRGDSEDFSISVENSGGIFLNNCSLSFSGEGGAWLSGSEVVGLSPGEKHSFDVSLVTSETVDPGIYLVTASALCEEGSNSSVFDVTLYRNSYEAEVLRYERVDDELFVTYSLQEFSGEQHEIVLNYALLDFDSVPRFRGEASVTLEPFANTEEVISFVLPKDSFGEFVFSMNLSDGVSFLTTDEDVFLPSSGGIGGLVVSEGGSRRLTSVGVGVFVLLGGSFVFWLYRRSKTSRLSRGSRQKEKSFFSFMRPSRGRKKTRK